jgi:hypothetical protein
VFKGLLSRFQEKKAPDHPLASDAGLDALMAEIPESDPRRLLFDIDQWLEGMEATAQEIGPLLALRALARLDQFSRPSARHLLFRYLSPGEREYQTDSAWSALDEHAAQQYRAYRLFIAPSLVLPTDDDKVRMARCAARAMMAWTLRKKLQHFRYRIPPPELWNDAHELLAVLGRLGLLKTVAAPYRNEPDSTPLAEYLIGVYLEFAPMGNLAPQQMEFIEGILRHGGGLEFSSHPLDQSTHQIDLALAQGPQRLKPGSSSGATVRFCSALKLKAPMMKFAALYKKPDAAPEWLGQCPASKAQIEAAVLVLMSHWGGAPPKRGRERVSRLDQMRVMLGFGLSRRMVAAAHFARMGRSLKYEGNDLESITRQFEATRFGSVTPNDEGPGQVNNAQAGEEVLTPLQILRKLETGGDEAQMEHWTQVDGSESGIGFIVPAVLPRHRIGVLLCFRETDGMDWRMGVIRRIGRDAANRPSVGIETLAWPSICALAKPCGQESAWTKVADGGGHGWSDAIIVSLEGRELVLPAGTFFENLDVELRSEFGQWTVRLEALLDRGPDFDRIKFSRIS